MKHSTIKFILFILFVILLTSCSKSVVTPDNTAVNGVPVQVTVPVKPADTVATTTAPHVASTILYVPVTNIVSGKIHIDTVYITNIREVNNMLTFTATANVYVEQECNAYFTMSSTTSAADQYTRLVGFAYSSTGEDQPWALSPFVPDEIFISAHL